MDDLALQESLLTRRQAVLSPSYFHHYDDPIHAVRAKGVTIWDHNGKSYLDCYNNVPSVGHCHPHVVSALARKASLINTHSRYLDDGIVQYAERLIETFPPEIDTCAFVCSGSEANALAYDIARTVTGRNGVVVSEGSYHGNALAVADFSLYRTAASEQPDFVQPIPVPDQTCGDTETVCPDRHPSLAKAKHTIHELSASQHGLAMLMIDPIFDAPGIFTAPPGYLVELAETTRRCGGLVVMDEVQAGLTRLGDNMWGFMDSGVVPDIVTMGKPMGAGYPLAVVAAKRDIFEAFASKRHYFNTFGGTPVAAAVGNAVLDVLEAQGIQESVRDVGGYLKAALQHLRDEFECIGAIRGKGLFLGVEIVKSRESGRADPARAKALVNDMRRRGVLIAACGVDDSVLKIRPPLVFSKANANELLDALRTSLATNNATA